MYTIQTLLANILSLSSPKIQLLREMIFLQIMLHILHLPCFFALLSQKRTVSIMQEHIKTTGSPRVRFCSWILFVLETGVEQKRKQRERYLFVNSLLRSIDVSCHIVSSGLTSQTKLSFISSNSSFSECVRQQIPAHHSPSSNIDQCTAATYASDTRCQRTGSHLPYSSGTHTFTNVDFKECSSSNDHGGAIKCTGSNTELTVTGCTFKDCRVSNPSVFSGGGICAESVKAVSTRSCLFTHCYGYNGGGMFIISISSTPEFSDCVFISCKVAYIGGGAFVGQCTKTSSFVACNDCLFIKGTNVSATSNFWGGGLYLNIYKNDEVNSVSNILFTFNSATAQGGGFRIYEKEYGLDYSIRFCFFSGNYASASGHDISLYNIKMHSVVDCYTTSNAMDKLYLDQLDSDTSSLRETTHTPNWLPQGKMSFHFDIRTDSERNTKLTQRKMEICIDEEYCFLRKSIP